MHKAISILLASGLLLVCTGCGLLEREYVQISQHQEQTAENDDATTLRAESYAELVGGSSVLCLHGRTQRHRPAVSVHGGHPKGSRSSL